MGAGECQHQALLLHPAGHSQSATSSCIPHGSFFMLLFLPLVPASFRAILLLLFLASSTLSIPGISTLLVLAVAGGDKCGNTWMGIHHPGGGALSSPTLLFSHRVLAGGICVPCCWKDPASGSPGRAPVPAHLHPREVGDG